MFLSLLICGNKYNLPRYTKLHSEAEVLLGVHRLNQFNNLNNGFLIGKRVFQTDDDHWKVGIITVEGKKDSKNVRV